jgi:hypothetical protein
MRCWIGWPICAVVLLVQPVRVGSEARRLQRTDIETPGVTVRIVEAAAGTPCADLGSYLVQLRKRVWLGRTWIGLSWGARRNEWVEGSRGVVKIERRLEPSRSADASGRAELHSGQSVRVLQWSGSAEEDANAVFATYLTGGVLPPPGCQRETQLVLFELAPSSRDVGSILPQITQALEDEDPVLRELAADTLGLMGCSASIALTSLERARGDSEPLVRKAAEKALGTMRSGCVP